VDRHANPGPGRAAFVVVVEAADMGNRHDPGVQSPHRPLENGIVYAPAPGRALGLIWVLADVAGDPKRSLQINGPQQRQGLIASDRRFQAPVNRRVARLRSPAHGSMCSASFGEVSP
jgi:hypothetical protein